MPDMLEILTQLVSISGIPEAFGVNAKSLLILVFGSFIVGYACLTFRYKIYEDNQKWKDLDYSEKTIFSLVIGFLSIFSSLLLITMYQLIYIQLGILNDDKYLEQFFSQLKYVSPFLYFIGLSALTKSYYIGLDFIKEYMKKSFTLISYSAFIFLIIILVLFKNWSALLGAVILLILFIILHDIIPYIRRKRK